MTRTTVCCNALAGLIDEVLFIEDPYEKGKYHPRVLPRRTHMPTARLPTDYEVVLQPSVQ